MLLGERWIDRWVEFQARLARPGMRRLGADTAVRATDIACDGASRSEIVVPILSRAGELVAIIDVDCAAKSGFDHVDRLWLEKLARLLGEACDW